MACELPSFINVVIRVLFNISDCSRGFINLFYIFIVCTVWLLMGCFSGFVVSSWAEISFLRWRTRLPPNYLFLVITALNTVKSHVPSEHLWWGRGTTLLLSHTFHLFSCSVCSCLLSSPKPLCYKIILLVSFLIWCIVVHLFRKQFLLLILSLWVLRCLSFMFLVQLRRINSIIK